MKTITLEKHQPLGAAQTGYSDDTADRIRAFMASMQPLGGMPEEVVESEEFQYARDLIEQLAAASTETDDPAIVLPLLDCAEILWFLTKLEPVEKRNWWFDQQHAPSHVVGFQIVLQTIEKSISAILDREEASPE